MAKKDAFKIPTKLGACADLLYTLRTERLKVEAEADALKKKETQLKDHLLAKLGADMAAEGVIGELATVRVLSETIPIVQDWDALAEYIIKHKAVDMLQKRLSGPAVAARWEEGKAIPGVEKFNSKKLSITKR
jgi:hypothetical protein